MMFKSLTSLLLIIILGLTACSILIPGNPTESPSSGIEGYVTLGPICPGPVTVGDLNCHDKPYEAKISVMDSNNHLITRFETEEAGYFKVNLYPGTYILHPESGDPLPFASDQTVIVTDTQYTPVSIQYDTGIR